MSDVMTIDNDNFAEIKASPAAVLDFYADWCGPCKTIAPAVAELAAQYADQGVKIGKVDIVASPDLATEFNITGVPTLLFFKGGEIVDQLMGAHSKAVIEGKIKDLV